MKNIEKNCYVAIDIGASSGKHYALWMDDGKLHMEEIYRFENRTYEENGSIYWDLELIWENILEGLRQVKHIERIPVSIGIDTWGSDYVLINRSGDSIGEVYSYRDERTENIFSLEQFNRLQAKLYPHTGIHYFPSHTLHQLIADKRQRQNALNATSRIMMIPEYFTMRLTGERCCEYTSAVTTGMVDAKTRNWYRPIMREHDLSQNWFPPICFPSQNVGDILDEVAEEIGYTTKVTLVGTHDTASAVMGTPLKKDNAYISSGTLSYIGMETKKTYLSEKSLKFNLSNEGGYDNSYHVQKTIRGLWLMQSLRLDQGEGITFKKMIDLAIKEIDFASRIDVGDKALNDPNNMGDAIDELCKKTGQQVPQNLGQRLACAYHSLAEQYKQTLDELENIKEKAFDAISIVGGGSQDRLLNQLTANVCNKKVWAGPVEATALGNGVCQMIHSGEFESLEKARKVIRNSFEIKLFEPGVDIQ